MKKIVFIVINILLFTNCIFIFSDISYRVKDVDNLGYSIEKTGVRSIGEKLAIYIDIAENFKQMKVYFYEIDAPSNELNKKILNDIIIKNKYEDIIIKKEDIIYNIKKGYQEKKYLETVITLPKELSGEIKINFGNVKIRDKIFKTPIITMKKYKESYSDSTIRAMLNEGGANLKPIYRKEDWIEE